MNQTMRNRLLWYSLGLPIRCQPFGKSDKAENYAFCDRRKRAVNKQKSPVLQNWALPIQGPFRSVNPSTHYGIERMNNSPFAKSLPDRLCDSKVAFAVFPFSGSITASCQSCQGRSSSPSTSLLRTDGRRKMRSFKLFQNCNHSNLPFVRRFVASAPIRMRGARLAGFLFFVSFGFSEGLECRAWPSWDS